MEELLEWMEYIEDVRQQMYVKWQELLKRDERYYLFKKGYSAG